jgi:hypothetical protein
MRCTRKLQVSAKDVNILSFINIGMERVDAFRERTSTWADTAERYGAERAAEPSVAAANARTREVKRRVALCILAKVSDCLERIFRRDYSDLRKA